MFSPFLRPSFINLPVLYHYKNIITILQVSADGSGDIFTPFSLYSNVFRNVEGKSVLLPVLVVMLNEKSTTSATSDYIVYQLSDLRL